MAVRRGLGTRILRGEVKNLCSNPKKIWCRFQRGDQVPDKQVQFLSLPQINCCAGNSSWIGGTTRQEENKMEINIKPEDIDAYVLPLPPENDKNK